MIIIQIAVVSRNRPGVLVAESNQSLFNSRNVTSFILHTFSQCQPKQIMVTGIYHIFARQADIGFVQMQIQGVNKRRHSLFQQCRCFFCQQFFCLATLFYFVPEGAVFIRNAYSFRFIGQHCSNLTDTALGNIRMLPRSVLCHTVNFRPCHQESSRTVDFCHIGSHLFRISADRLHISQFTVFSHSRH